MNDTARLVHAVNKFTVQNKAEINEVNNWISGVANDVYDNEIVQRQFQNKDSLITGAQEKDLFGALKQVYTLISVGETDLHESEKAPWNWLLMFISSLMYAIVILFTYNYFEVKYAKYFSSEIFRNKQIHDGWKEFESVFLVYFRQRSKVVIICMLFFMLAFSIMNLPGAIIIGVIVGLLCYASQFHYFSLPLALIGCWILSVENDLSFFLFFGIVLSLYIVISILEETVFFDKIMKSVKGMNPAIMILAFTFWIYVLGPFAGTLLALPLTQLVMIYLDRLMLFLPAKSSK